MKSGAACDTSLSIIFTKPRSVIGLHKTLTLNFDKDSKTVTLSSMRDAFLYYVGFFRKCDLFGLFRKSIPYHLRKKPRYPLGFFRKW